MRALVIFVLLNLLLGPISSKPVEHNTSRRSSGRSRHHSRESSAGVAGERPGTCPVENPFAGSFHQKGKGENPDRLRSRFVLAVGRYIVRFVEYRQAEELRKDLVALLGSEGKRWNWIERRNKAAEFPTDFGIVNLGKELLDRLKELIPSVASIRDVHPDSKILRTLKFDTSDTSDEGAVHGFCGEDGSVEKIQGRLHTRWTMDEDDENVTSLRKLLLMEKPSFASVLKAEKVWDQGYSGKKVKVGIFDTGVRKDHPHIKNIKERTNWTHEPTLDDGLGHGSFVAGVVASSHNGCLGLAPDVDLHTFRVFTNDQVSYTSWFMDAFNYAIITEMNIVNLSIGGPDYLDEPFVDKVLEVTSNGILMVSAIGNDGPLYGTLNNPADQNDVIGVGGVNYQDRIAHFSSRGMSSWELPLGYGRIKPDIMAYAQDVRGSKIQTGCRTLSGTSVASPVATGAVCLLASTVPEENRWGIVNPASMKQALVEGANRLDGMNIYEQGSGRLNLSESMHVLQNYKPRASVVPATLDLSDCPYMWPFCTQPLYAHAMPVMVNATILNGMGVVGEITSPPVFEPKGEHGGLIEMDFDYSSRLWPWSGFLGLYIRVKDEGEDFEGVVEGEVVFTVTSQPARGEDQLRKSQVRMPFKAEVIPTPPREKRILWDQFHSVKYPPAYLPRDNLDIKNDILDWHGDHPHTNFHNMFDYLREHDYFLEILGSPFTCFDAKQYGALLIVDSEDEFYPEEIEKLEQDVREEGLGLVVFADWYNVQSMKKMVFFDDNTRSWWKPVTGGANVPALNDLLEGFGIALGDTILRGQFQINKHQIRYSSGANLIRFPAGSYLHAYDLEKTSASGRQNTKHEILGLTEVEEGRVAVFGDSSCLDSSYLIVDCFSLLEGLLEFTTKGAASSDLLPVLLGDSARHEQGLGSNSTVLPSRPSDVDFKTASFTLTNPLQCYKNSGTFYKGKKEKRSASKKQQEEELESRTVSGLKESKKPEEVVNLEEDAVHSQGMADLGLETKAQIDPSLQKSDASSATSTAEPSILSPQEQETIQPPLIVSKWSALVGVLVMVGLYRLTRRRQPGKKETSEHAV
ncbi:hypothetical protein BSKO_07110 [Bryopsis sp. KO-2023]|nr:hypothetical protein BSKO_07110 [Bryopsis sp. KO-2023]